MHRSVRALGSVAFLCAVLPGSVVGQVRTLTFDEDPSIGLFPGLDFDLSHGFGGLYWRDIYFVSPDDAFPAWWWTWGRNSPYDLADGYGVAAARSGAEIYAPSPFDLYSAYVASDDLAGVGLNVWGFRNGTATYFRSFVIGVEAPTLLDFGFRGIDRVRFETLGGCASPRFTGYLDDFYGPDFPDIVAHSAFPGPGYCRGTTDARFSSFAMDNVRVGVAPEPMTVVLLATGLLGLAVVSWRRRRPLADERRSS